MHLLDVNVLVAGLNPNHLLHVPARRWMDEAFEDSASIGIPWHSILGFIRVSTNQHVTRRNVTFDEVWRAIDTVLHHPSVWIPSPTPRHAELFHNLMQHTPRTPNWISDAHLAALAIEHNLTLVSTDGGFTRFPGLRFLNPLSVT